MEQGMEGALCVDNDVLLASLIVIGDSGSLGDDCLSRYSGKGG